MIKAWAQKNKNQLKLRQSGFTLVELLIVIVVIAVLAAISVVAYNGIQNRAHNTAVQNDLSNLGKKIELFKVGSSNERYPALADLGQLEFSANKNSYMVSPATSYNLIYCLSGTRESYAVLGISKSADAFYVAHDSGGVKALPGFTVNASNPCAPTGVAAGANNNRGYAAESTPQWRAWTGS